MLAFLFREKDPLCLSNLTPVTLGLNEWTSARKRYNFSWNFIYELSYHFSNWFSYICTYEAVGRKDFQVSRCRGVVRNLR